MRKNNRSSVCRQELCWNMAAIGDPAVASLAIGRVHPRAVTSWVMCSTSWLARLKPFNGMLILMEHSKKGERMKGGANHFKWLGKPKLHQKLLYFRNSWLVKWYFIKIGESCVWGHHWPWTFPIQWDLFGPVFGRCWLRCTEAHYDGQCRETQWGGCWYRWKNRLVCLAGFGIWRILPVVTIFHIDKIGQNSRWRWL